MLLKLSERIQSRDVGDTINGIRFELYPGDRPTVVKEALRKGERVFVTESDDYLFRTPLIPSLYNLLGQRIWDILNNRSKKI